MLNINFYDHNNKFNEINAILLIILINNYLQFKIHFNLN